MKERKEELKMLDELNEKMREAGTAVDSIQQGVETMRTELLNQKINAMKTELEEMRTRLDRLARETPSEDDWSAPKERHLASEMARCGKTAGIGVWRLVVLQDSRGRAVSAVDNVHLQGLGFDEQQILERVRSYSDPLVLRAMHRLISRHLEGSEMSMSRKYLAAALGVDEPALEASLRPLFEREVVRRILNPAGEEIYEVCRADEFLLLL